MTPEELLTHRDKKIEIAKREYLLWSDAQTWIDAEKLATYVSKRFEITLTGCYPQRITIDQATDTATVFCGSHYVRGEYEELLFKPDCYVDSCFDLAHEINLRQGNCIFRLIEYSPIPKEDQDLLRAIGKITTSVTETENLVC